MMRVETAATGALVVTVVGMMLVVVGVVTPGLFLAGVVLTGVGMLGFAGAGLLAVAAPPTDGTQNNRAMPADTAPMTAPRT